MQNQGGQQQQHGQHPQHPQHQHQYSYGASAIPAGGVAPGTATGVPPFCANQLPSLHSYLHSTPTSTSNFAPAPPFAPQAQQNFIPPNLVAHAAAAAAANQGAQWPQQSGASGTVVPGSSFSPHLSGAAFGAGATAQFPPQPGLGTAPQFASVQPNPNATTAQFPQAFPAAGTTATHPYGAQFAANPFLQSISPPVAHQQLFPEPGAGGSTGDASHAGHYHTTGHYGQDVSYSQPSQQQVAAAAVFHNPALFGAAEYASLGQQQPSGHSLPASSTSTQWDGTYPQPPQPGQVQSISQLWQQHSVQSAQQQSGAQPQLQQPQAFQAQAVPPPQTSQEPPAPQKYGSTPGDPQAAFYATVTPPPPAAPKPQRPATSAQFFAATAAAVSSPVAAGTPPPHAHSQPTHTQKPKDTLPGQEQKPVATASGFGAGGFVGWEMYPGEEENTKKETGKPEETVHDGGVVEMPAKTPPIPQQLPQQHQQQHQTYPDFQAASPSKHQPFGGTASITAPNEAPWSHVGGVPAAYAPDGIGADTQGHGAAAPQYKQPSPVNYNALNAPHDPAPHVSATHTPSSVTSGAHAAAPQQTLSPKLYGDSATTGAIQGYPSSSPGHTTSHGHSPQVPSHGQSPFQQQQQQNPNRFSVSLQGNAPSQPQQPSFGIAAVANLGNDYQQYGGFGPALPIEPHPQAGPQAGPYPGSVAADHQQAAAIAPQFGAPPAEPVAIQPTVQQYQPPPVVPSSIFIGEAVHTTPSPTPVQKVQEPPRKFLDQFIPADLDSYYVDSIYRFVAMIKLEAAAADDIERLRIFNQFIDDEYRRRGARYPDAICVDPPEKSEQPRRFSTQQQASHKPQKTYSAGDDSPLAKAIADLEGDFDSISLAAAAEATPADNLQRETRFKPRPLSFGAPSPAQQQHYQPSPPLQATAGPSYQAFSPPLNQGGFNSKRASIAQFEQQQQQQPWNTGTLSPEPVPHMVPSSEDVRIESTLAQEAKKMVENRQKHEERKYSTDNTGAASAYMQPMYMEANKSQPTQKRASPAPRTNTSGLPGALVAGPGPGVKRHSLKDVRQPENDPDGFVVVPNSVSPEVYSSRPPPGTKPPRVGSGYGWGQEPQSYGQEPQSYGQEPQLYGQEPQSYGPPGGRPDSAAQGRPQQPQLAEAPADPRPVQSAKRPSSPAQQAIPKPASRPTSQPPYQAAPQPIPQPVSQPPPQAAPEPVPKSPPKPPPTSGGIAALSAVLGAGRKVRPAKSRALEPIRKQLETIGTDVAFVDEVQKTFDVAAKKIRNKNEAERDREKTEHDEYYDDLYNAKKITYEDLRDAEEDIVLKMNEHKDKEENDEFQRYIAEVFTPMYTKLQERIGYLKTEYTKAVHFTKIASAGKQKYEDVASQPELLDTLNLLVELYDAIELQSEVLQKKVLAERAKRYKSTVLNPLYRDHSSNKVETLRNMRKHFEDDDNKAALDAAQETIYRARSLMSTVRECMESGLNLEIGFFHEIQPVLVATLEKLPEDLKDYSGDVGHLHNEAQYAFDVLKALTETQATMMKIFHKANKSLNGAEQTFDVCDAKIKGSSADEVKDIVTQKEEQSKVLDEELNERLEHINGYFAGVKDSVLPSLTNMKKFLGIPQAEE